MVSEWAACGVNGNGVVCDRCMAFCQHCTGNRPVTVVMEWCPSCACPVHGLQHDVDVPVTEHWLAGERAVVDGSLTGRWFACDCQLDGH